MERHNSTLMNRIQLLKVFFFSNQSKVYVVMKQEIETKSWVKQICAIINHKIETKSKMNDDTVINGRKLHVTNQVIFLLKEKDKTSKH